MICYEGYASERNRPDADYFQDTPLAFPTTVFFDEERIIRPEGNVTGLDRPDTDYFQGTFPPFATTSFFGQEETILPVRRVADSTTFDKGLGRLNDSHKADGSVEGCALYDRAHRTTDDVTPTSPHNDESSVLPLTSSEPSLSEPWLDSLHASYSSYERWPSSIFEAYSLWPLFPCVDAPRL